MSANLRQKALENGLSHLSADELIALVAGIDIRLAKYILSHSDGLLNLAEYTVVDLLSIEGIGEAKALSILSALQLAQRLLNDEIWHRERVIIQRPSDAIQYILFRMSQRKQEELIVLLLDVNNRLMNIETIYIGTLTATVVRVAEIFRPAIVQNAASIIVAHNHPSGDPIPSEQDIQLTSDMDQIGKQLDIPFVDHLIIASGRWISLREQGLGFGSK